MAPRTPMPRRCVQIALRLSEDDAVALADGADAFREAGLTVREAAGRAVADLLSEAQTDLTAVRAAIQEQHPGAILDIGAGIAAPAPKPIESAEEAPPPPVPVEKPTPPGEAAPRRRKVVRSPQDVLRTLATRGLRDDEGHDLVRGRNARRFIPGKGPLIRPNGMGIDEAGEVLHEDGFFLERPTTTEVLELLDRALAGEKIFSLDDTGEVQRRGAEEQVKDQERQRRDAQREVRDLAGEISEKLTDQEVNDLAEAMLRDGLGAEEVLFDLAERRAIEHESDLAEKSGEAQTAEQERETDAVETRERSAGPARPEQPQEAAEPGVAGQGPARAAAVEEDRGPTQPDRGEESREVAPQTERTPEGEQSLIPGVAPVTDKDRAEAQIAKPLRGGDVAPAGGLFDGGLPPDLFESGDVKAQLTRPGGPFFSSLMRGVEGLKQPKAPAAQWKAMIQKLPGVKAEEIEWSDVIEWLGDRKAVTKDELVQFIAENQVQIEETTKGETVNRGEAIEAANRGQNVWPEGLETGDSLSTSEIERVAGPDDRFVIGGVGTKFSTYQLPGGENYRELLLQLPSNQNEAAAARSARIQELTDRRDGLEAQLRRANDEGRGREGANRAELRRQIRNTETQINVAMRQGTADPGAFTGGHYDEPNVLAHVRFNERTDADGKKVLFVEEIQSDWHQMGRKSGYLRSEDAGKFEVFETTTARVRRVFDTEEEAEKFIRGEPDRDGLDVALAGRGGVAGPAVPDAPFKTSWHELAFKRMLRYAAENGFDSLAWTTGEMQAERYDLGKRIKDITLHGQNDNLRLSATDHSDRKVIDMQHTTAEGLSDIIGKEPADKLLSQPEPDPSNPFATRNIFGADLKVGGEGMKGFYDRMLPRFANKYGKKWGARVGETTIPTADDLTQRAFEGEEELARKPLRVAVHSLDVTPPMRESVLEGQPLFDKPQTATRFTESELDAKIPDDVTAAQDILKTQVQVDADAVVSQLKNRMKKLGIADKIALEVSENLTLALKSGEAVEANGLFYRSERLIQIALSADRGAARTLDHEIVHALRALGLINKREWKTLERAARADKGRMADVRQRNDGLDLTEEQLLEEAIADMFADWVAARPDSQRGFVRTVFQRIRNFLRALGQALKNRGFKLVFDDAPEVVFERIEAGKIGRRRERAPRRPRESRGRGVKPSVRRPGPSATSAKKDATGDGLAGRSFDFTSRSARDYLYDQNLTLLARVSHGGRVAFDEARIKLQDKFLSLKRIQEAIARARGLDHLPEEIDAYLAEELFHGIAGAQLDDFKRDHVEPLIEAIDDADLTLEDVELFLYARHAPERNAQIAKINPDLPDGGSGMTDTEAEQVMDQFARDRLTARLEPIAERVDRINRLRLRTLLRGGLIDEFTVERWGDTYKSYIPLRGWEQGDETADGTKPRTGKGFDIRGEETKRALGRTSRPGTILGYALGQVEEAIVRAEKNKVGQALLKLARENPNPDIWEVNARVLMRRIDRETGLVEFVPDLSQRRDDNVLAVKEGAKVQYITIHHESLARAMKNLGAESMNGVILTLQRINRYLAFVNTSLNPEFVISNFTRDLQTAGINIQALATDEKGITAEIMGAVPKALRGAFKGLRGNKTDEWAKNFHEFNNAGGKIAFFGLVDIETRRKRLQNMLSDLDPSAARQARIAARSVFDFVQDVNSAVENGVRLSTFVALRDRGVSTRKAASVARNLTVNFNRKGEWGAAAGAMFLFYNASIQGTAIMYRALHTKRVRRVVGGVILSFFALDILNALISPEDDDKEKKYDKISQWTRDHNLIVMNPFAGDEVSLKDAIAFKMPLPYGYNVFASMGTKVGQVVRGKKTPLEASADLVAIALNSFNPLGGDTSILKTMTPTLLKPAFELETNRNFAGNPIAPENNPYGLPLPDSQLFWSSVSAPSKAITQQLNRLTGGSTLRPGMVDVSPETLDHLVNFTTGGAGMFVARNTDFVIKMAQGEKIEWRNIPFARRLIEGNNVYWERQRFREVRDAALLAERELKVLPGAGMRDDLAKSRVEHSVDFKMIGIVKAAGKAMRPMFKARNQIKASKKLSREAKNQKLESIDSILRRIQLRVLRRYNTLKERKSNE